MGHIHLQETLLSKLIKLLTITKEKHLMEFLTIWKESLLVCLQEP